MLKAILSEVLLRQIPDHLRAGMETGDYKLYGSIIRSVSHGRIVGHLQETGGIGEFVGNMLSMPISAPLQGSNLAVNVIGQAASFVQNEQIKAAVANLQNVQLAGLALGAAGIGVSVVGFAILSSKIQRVETKVEAIGDKLDVLGLKIEALRREAIAEDMVRLRTAAQRMDEGWQLNAPEAQWRDVAKEMHFLQNNFSRRLDDVLSGNRVFDLTSADPFIEALALASAVRVSARLAAGDELVAREAAHEGATLLALHGRRFRLADIALADLRTRKSEAATPNWGVALKHAAEAARPMIEAMRTREAAAASTTLTLGELGKRLISGRAWMETARAETVAPYLFLPSD
jgi:hypothetical protein